MNYDNTDNTNDLKKELSEAKLYAKQQKELRKIEKIKSKYEKKSPMGFDKKMFIFEMVDFIAIEVFAMWAMVHFEDASQISSLLGLIAPVVGGVVAYKSYTDKATAQNTVGGITYDIAMKNWEQQNSVDSNSCGDSSEDSTTEENSGAVG